MQTFIVTGGAGFIGSHLCAELLKSGDFVICIDNFITGSPENIQEFRSNPNFTFIEHDLTKPLPAIEGDIDGIFHFASPASPNKKSPKSYIAFPIETLLVNSVGTYNLLELAREKNAKFVYASTSEVYGNPEISPQVETYFGNVNPNGIRSVYDEGKRFGEATIMAFVRKYDLDGRILRIFNTYGDKMQKDDGRVVSNFIVQALENSPITIFGDGTQTRSFCFVSDLVDGILEFMKRDGLKGEVVNLGNPEERTVKELAEIVKKLTNSSSEILFEELPEDDPMKRRPDISKAQKLLEFSPKVSIEEGLIKTIEYFQTKT
jgi:nucleoside-diphosphate-sugar epimerase